ncbi:hypothetical protein [Roseisolibacter sp. H3M3-2]|uniref:hypothetical protein n=1 Tax=Roseisolibacter sp. H3M3-2 TaxID=3031323 RepID=UPI0023DA3878|nr:hypothetical protein [Roseisolibacter sp. H3M3-2]MDF1504384.1 hypothetical protein [Roseisolibacter sp. H3M3-2]
MRHVSRFALAALLVACDDGTAPAPATEAGRYVATSLRGRPLPAVTDSSAQEFGVLLADTLELDGRGGGRRAYAVRRVHRALGIDTVYRVAAPTAYRRDGARLVVGSFTPCPPNASCLANDEGTVEPTRVTLATQRYAGGDPVVLARVTP